jgi:hypothetical protein
MERMALMSPRSAGFLLMISATVPATCGVAMDVPLNTEYPSVGTLLRMFTPGAAMFGLISPPNGDGPRLENDAMLLLMS